jgi:hypothetical protein
MGVRFLAPTETAAQGLVKAMHDEKFQNVDVGPMRWPFRRWEVAGEGPPPKNPDLPTILLWIEHMIELGARFEAHFDIWAPVQPGA